MVTPLDVRSFFSGIWHGEGELIPHAITCPFVSRQAIRCESEPTWLSDTVWMVREKMEFQTGWTYERKMFAELIRPDRVHLTADDMPLGADMSLRDDGFFFTPYYAWGSFHGRRYWMRCDDSCQIDTEGRIHDTIKMRYLKMPAGTMRIVWHRSPQPQQNEA